MIERELGRTGLTVSALGLGCAQLTGEFGVNRQDAAAILDEARGAGISLVDTAPLYGAGESEELVGRALRRHPGWHPTVSTKIGYLDVTIVHRVGEAAFTDPERIRRVIKHSLWLLQLDHVEIVHVHEPDWPQWGLDETAGEGVVISVLEDLKREGVVRCIGVGGWDSDGIARLVRSGRVDVALIAGGVTLVDRPMFRELVPAARESGAGLMLGGAFGQNSRFLISPSRPDLERLSRSAEQPERTLARKLDSIYALAEELGLSLPELAVRYVLALEDIHSHVGGARNASQLAANVAAVSRGPLSADVVRRIEEIQDYGPTPGPAEVARLGRRGP